MASESQPGYLRIGASPPRLFLGVFFVGALAALVAMLAATGRYDPGSRIVLLIISGAVAYVAMRLWQARDVVLELTPDALREVGQDGRVLADIANIKGIDRGAFAFKPSNGFLIHLKTSQANAWVPGIWWRWGRFVGVGGLLAGNEAKRLAETIALDLAQKDLDGSR